MFFHRRDVPPQIKIKPGWWFQPIWTNRPIETAKRRKQLQDPTEKDKWEAEVQNHPDHQALRPILRASEHGLKKCAWSTAMYDVQPWWWTVTKRGGASQIILVNFTIQPILFVIPQVLQMVVTASPHFYLITPFRFNFSFRVRFRACYYRRPEAGQAETHITYTQLFESSGRRRVRNK